MKKQKLTNLFKLGILIFGIPILILNCEKNDEIIETQEPQIERKLSKISFDQFKTNIKSNENIENYSRLLNSENVSSKSNFNNKSSHIFNNATIIKDNIKRIKEDNYSTYTFAILTQTKGYEFYNLVLYVDDNSQEIFKSHILKYTPSEDWITDSTQTFSGNVKIIDNETFDVNNLLPSKSLTYAKSSNSHSCVSAVSYGWECDNGVSGHSHGSPGRPKCVADSFDFVINIEYEECPSNGNDNGDFDTKDYGNESSEATGGGGGNTGIATSPNTVPYTSQFKNFISSTLTDLKVRAYYNRNSQIKSTIDNYLIAKYFFYTSKLEARKNLEIGEKLDLNADQFNWVFENPNPNNFIDIKESLIDESNEAKTYIKGQIELEALYSDNKIKLKPKNGKINNRDDQKYTHFGTDGVYSFYTMEDGSRVLNSPTQLTLNSDGQLVSKFTSETSNDHYWYIKLEGRNEWSNYLIKTNNTNLAHELEITAKLALTALGKAIGTYILPVEDAKILITGTDFDGEQVSRLQTAGFMIVGIVPGGKLLKPLSKGTGKVWKVVIKNGDKVFTRTVRELTEETIQHFDRYAEGASLYLQEALRKGDVLDNEIIIEVGQEIADLSTKKSRRLTWPEVKALFKRGNDFNKKALDEYGYNSVEIVLADGKRLDTYIHGQKILSRKATDIDNIKESTWRNYCNELVTKYKAGKLTNSRKLNTQVNLSGKYYLEIPASNQNANNLERFKQIASEYGRDNQTEGIIITFLIE